MKTDEGETEVLLKRYLLSNGYKRILDRLYFKNFSSAFISINRMERSPLGFQISIPMETIHISELLKYRKEYKEEPYQPINQDIYYEQRKN